MISSTLVPRSQVNTPSLETTANLCYFEKFGRWRVEDAQKSHTEYWHENTRLDVSPDGSYCLRRHDEQVLDHLMKWHDGLGFQK